MSALLSRSPAKKSPKEKPAPTKVEEEKKSAFAKASADKGKVGEKKPVEEKKAKPAFSVPNLYWRLAIAGILAPILIGGIFFASGKLKTLVKEIEEKRGQLVALSEREVSFQKVASDLASVEEEIPLIEKALPNEEEMIDFLNQVEKLKAEAEIEIKTLSFTSDLPQLDGAGYTYLELAFEASGPVANLKKFLENLLSLPIVIKAKTVDITKMDEGESKLVFRAWLYTDPNFFLE